MVQLSQRALQLMPSPTLAISAQAKEMRMRGEDVINMGAGELDLSPPSHVAEAVQQALATGHTTYTSAAGILPLREAVMADLKQGWQVEYSFDEIAVMVGAKQALYNVFQVLLDLGDEVVVPAPYWVSYVEQIKLAGGVPIILSTKIEDRFLLDPDDLQQCITPRTKVLVLNTPGNPTGVVYPQKRLAALTEICLKHGIWIISDEIYSRLIHASGVKHTSPLHMDREVADRTIWIHGVSKTYAMTGYRIGFAAGNRDVIQAMVRLSSQSTSNPTSIAQYAALAALTGPQDSVVKTKKILADRCQRVQASLTDLPHISSLHPDGAFYVFLNVASCLHPGEDDFDFAKRLLFTEKIAAVPGTAFGKPGYLRLSYALDDRSLQKALARLRHALKLSVH
ncbi:pyridoxal phosphate-dependent aminotransferase [Pasteuria penetrans]|uniref:pyridoxal phosphate-dependent aminotransferase n=1 Tax=Pasteuria penetrans TaxID=86005 RepID=UPI000FACCED2|nr:pyridoxal phosphate-dependent aminotransferase [Pasteuria penetrans]